MTNNILDKIINEIKSKNQESKTLLSLIDPNLPFSPRLKSDLSLGSLVELLINYVYHENFDEANKILENNNSFSGILNQVPPLAFDIAALMLEPDRMLSILNEYSLDIRRCTSAFIEKSRILILENSLEELKNLYNRLFKRMNKLSIAEFAENEFQKAMQFSKSITKRDYEKPLALMRIFDIPQEKTYAFAFEEFIYQKKQKEYVKSAIIARDFCLPEQSVLTASFLAFEKEFELFIEKFKSNKYDEKLISSNDDPYTSALNIVKDFHLLEKPLNTEQDSTVHKGKVQNVVFTNFKIITSKNDFPNIALAVKTFLASRLLIDYELDSMKKSNVLLNLIEDAIRWIVNQIDDDLKNIDDADHYYEILKNLSVISFSHKKTIKRIADRIFELYLNEDLLKKAQQTIKDFGLYISDILASLLDLCRKFLHNGEFNHFREIVSMFELKQKIRSDPNFLDEAYDIYYNSITGGKYRSVEIIQDICEFSKKRRLKPLKVLVKQKIIDGEDKETNQIFQTFKFGLSDVSREIVEIYDIHTETDVLKAKNFRLKYGLSIIDIGILKWFFRELIPLTFFYKKIDDNKKNDEEKKSETDIKQ